MVVKFNNSEWDAIEARFSTDFPRMAHSAGLDAICEQSFYCNAFEEVEE